jgi:RNA polymerase sigma factor (sigma-70 family)
VLVNLVLDGSAHRRRRRDELAVPDDALRVIADHRATQALHSVDEHDGLRRALGELPRKERALMVLRYWDDLPEREIARLLGCSTGTVKKTAWRAMLRLRRSLRVDLSQAGDADPPVRAADLVTVPDDEGSAP